MQWQDVGKAIGKTAPIIGTLLAPITGGASVAVASLVSNLLGVDNTPTAVIDALKANPDKLLELQKYELDHKIELQKLQLADVTAHLQDVQSARQRQIEHEKVVGTDINLYLLAWTIIVGFFALVATMIFVQLPSGSNEVIFMLFGSLAAGFGSVLTYFFGSSKSSSDKTLLMSKGTK